MNQALVLVHGIFDTGTIFNKMAHFFKKRGLHSLAPSLHPSSGAEGLEVLARQLQQYIDTHIPADQPLNLIGFSMGGLICRYYLQRLGGMQRVQRFVAISVPQHGSLLAWFIPNRGCRQMRPGSLFLQDLDRDVASLTAIDVLSLWTPFDLMIIPAKSSVLGVGKELQVPVLLHDWMIKDTRVLTAIASFLSAEQDSTSDTSDKNMILGK